MEETREGEVLSVEDTEKEAELVSGPEVVFIHDLSSDSVVMLKVIAESRGLLVTSKSVSA